MKSLVEEWNLSDRKGTLYAANDGSGLLIFFVSGNIPSEIINAEPPVALVDAIEKNLGFKEAPNAFTVDTDTGALTEVPKLTDQRKRVFELVKFLQAFEAASESYSSDPIGPKRATKIIEALKDKGTFGGVDIRSAYDACSFGGAFIVDDDGKFSFGRLTLHDDGTRVLEPYVSATKPEFERWLAWQSEWSLVCGPNILPHSLPANYKLHTSLISDIKRVI